MAVEWKRAYTPVGGGWRGCKQMEGWLDVHMDGMESAQVSVRPAVCPVGGKSTSGHLVRVCLFS